MQLSAIIHINRRHRRLSPMSVFSAERPSKPCSEDLRQTGKEISAYDAQLAHKAFALSAAVQLKALT